MSVKKDLSKIVRKEVDDSHYYWVNDHYAPGVTTILEQAAPVAPQLKKYFIENSVEEISRKSKDSLDRGSRVHADAESLFLGKEVNLETYINHGVEYPRSYAEKKMVASVNNWYDDVSPSRFKLEQVLASLDPLYAGTADFSGWLNSQKVAEALNESSAKKFKFEKEEELWLVDYKTSAGIYFNYKLQVKAYQKAYEEMYGVKIDHVGVLRLGTRHARWYEFEEVRDEDISFEDFKRIYDTYLKINGGKIPTPPEVLKFPGVLKIDKLSKEAKEKMEGGDA